MEFPERDGDGYLANMNIWTPEIGRAMAQADGFELDDVEFLRSNERCRDVSGSVKGQRGRESGADVVNR